MDRHEGRARLQAPVDLGEGAPALVRCQKVQGQQAGGGIERAVGRVVDIAVMELHAGIERPQGLAGKRQHRGRRIDAVEAPARLRLGEGLQLQATAGTQNQHARV